MSIRKVLSLYRLDRIRRFGAKRSWGGFYNAIIELQRALPESNDQRVVELKTHLTRARDIAGSLMTNR